MALVGNSLSVQVRHRVSNYARTEVTGLCYVEEDVSRKRGDVFVAIEWRCAMKSMEKLGQPLSSLLRDTDPPCIAKPFRRYSGCISSSPCRCVNCSPARAVSPSVISSRGIDQVAGINRASFAKFRRLIRLHRPDPLSRFPVSRKRVLARII